MARDTVNTAPEGKPDPKVAEQANAEVQAKADEATSKGYIGVVNDPNPNDAYSIKSGPDSPPLVPDNQTRFEQPKAVTGKEAPNA